VKLIPTHFRAAPVGIQEMTDAPMCGPHFCSMKISEDVRQYAAEQAISEEEVIQKGMAEKSKEFAEAGSEVYVPA
jgi:phosphomethylpyrimidine synthase